jgi:hypothetical protein
MVPTSILSQYVLETLALTTLVFVALVPRLKERDPRSALVVLAALNVLRFGGVAGSLAALSTSPSPAFLVAVAVGDGVAATLALVALVLLRRRSGNARRAVLAMNVAGLLGILVSESWLEALDLSGHLVRSTRLHGPTIGAALYTALHVLAFYLEARGARREAFGGRALAVARVE